MYRFEITQSGEWREILALMRRELDRHKENLIIAAGRGTGRSKAFGLYDGYRQAIEKLESLGGDYVREEEEESD